MNCDPSSELDILIGKQQDTIGDIHITRAGTDPNLPPIALAFPLDSTSPTPFTKSSFQIALQAFLSIEKEINNDITLLGFSSPPGNEPLGRDVWDGTLSLLSAYERFPALEAFENEKSVSEFPLSAIFECVESEREGKGVSIIGSPVLVRQLVEAGKGVGVDMRVENGGSGGWMNKRCPVVRTEGKEGEVLEMVKVGVEKYGEYVRKLFDNFD